MHARDILALREATKEATCFWTRGTARPKKVNGVTAKEMRGRGQIQKVGAKWVPMWSEDRPLRSNPQRLQTQLRGTQKISWPEKPDGTKNEKNKKLRGERLSKRYETSNGELQVNERTRRSEGR